jgi:hypothetical protein
MTRYIKVDPCWICFEIIFVMIKFCTYEYKVLNIIVQSFKTWSVTKLLKLEIQSFKCANIKLMNFKNKI